MPSGQDQVIPIHCPRCGGAMYKPAGSLFYWHTDRNHPPCTITNFVDVSTSAQVTEERTNEPGSKPKARQQK